jgi:uncharacterized protein (TIRG00374 family)
MRKNMTVSFVGGVILSAGALYFAFKNVPVAELYDYLVSINLYWILPAIFVAISSFFLRAIRWRIILESTRKINVWQAFHPMMIGFMINCVLPGRLGEIARPIILQKKEKIPFGTGLATVVTERVFDICLLVLLFMLTAGVLRANPDLHISFGTYQLDQKTLQTVFSTMLKMGAVLLLGIGIFSIGRARIILYNGILLVPKLFFFAGERFKTNIKNKICDPAIHILKNIAQGFELIKDPKRIVLCTGYSALIWGLQAFSYYLFSLGSPGINLTYLEITTVMVIICIFISLPSVPGWWGLWEAGGVFALSLLDIPAKDAAGFTLANHAIQVIPVILIGLYSAMLLSVNIRRISFEGGEIKNTGN